MKLGTMGHACMVLAGEGERPILATDPWLLGSCYWRSWWMVNPPGEEQIRRIEAAPFIYITHEHPDHLHLPSLKTLKPGERTILLPAFLRMTMETYLRDQGFEVRIMPPRQWVPLEEGVSAMSLPQWSNDSVLLVDTPSAFIVNLNDAKPLGGLLDDIARLRTEIGKPCLVLRSYSPAGPFFNYFEKGRRVPSRDREDYVRMTQGVCAHLKADLFLPFASQVVYRRSDSEWANDYRVGFDLMRAGWTIPTRLCPPFSTVDLDTLSVTAEPPEEWRGALRDRQRGLIAKEEARSSGAVLGVGDIAALKATFARQRWLLAAVLPRGIAVESGGRRFLYAPWSGRLRETDKGGDCAIRIPAAALKDSLASGNFGDLCIGMFVPTELRERSLAERVNLFWMLMILADYGYADGILTRLRWLLWAWRVERRRPIAQPG
ncbi:MBL fold metallo-hydrolase [Parvibaculum sp.]|uniref:MBL fold metallo-hydrolase n=1 Tax=Parvibaculum sp. TaxID=2024848 RepID=UPI001B13A67A|nr:MBL fold metallo-hydrolase [Parvibaculum sp.]MBO6634187.1 MBL fold metallo-hydrolase [Parvibaculum sp.]MBO6676952.1 MBL fold metallo-hydrolase [Parvibaculum sp.]MBO6686328.1 MBL fold metallo-hydrolase [Parvibaculum sp.]MBO6904085.1 MBL fold metallo-hydrolase [Parvibaculum sp.]